MKKVILLIVICFFGFLSCTKKDTSNNSNNSNPNNSTQTGTVTFTISQCQCILQPSYKCIYHNLGLGYSSTDIANNAFFQSTSNSKNTSDTYSYTLNVGTYYYKATAKNECSNQVDCSYPCGYGQLETKTKSGAFTIEANKTINVSISL